MRVLYSGFTYSGHSAMGGYDKITNIDLDKKILLRNVFQGNKINLFGHQFNLSLISLELITKYLRRNYDIVHYYYGEYTRIPRIRLTKLKKNKSVISLHQDINLLSPKFVATLPQYDGIIVLSRQQQKLLKEKYGIDSVFIPHGFTQPQFLETIPADIKGNKFNPDKINILTIGQMYRDFDTYGEIIQKYGKNVKFHFHLVGVPERIKDLYKEHPNISVYPRLSDDEFYTLISKSDYGFLPVTFATANNTLLESQYLNLPSILPRIEGISDYAAPAPLNLFYNNLNELEAIFSGIEKRAKDDRLNRFAKDNFDWSVIYSQLKDFYSSLFR